MLRKVWDKCTKRVWGSYGIDSQLRPSRIFIQTPDKEYTYSGNLDYIDKIEYKGTYATIVPIRNRNLFYIEPPASPEYLFDPSLKSLEPANHHLYCAGAASNLMANRLAGRMGYNSETKEYQLLKIDFNLSASPLVYAKFKVKERDYRYLMCTGLSPDGRIIVQGMPESIHFYDFDSGKLLDSLAFNGKYSYGKNSYVFDPFHKKLYISTSEKTEVYEFKTGKLSSHALEATQIKADNSNMHMAYWNDKSNLLHIMNLKHQAVKVFGLPDLENVDVRQINAVDFSADDRLIAVLANKGFGKTCLYVYDLKHEKLLRKIELFDFVNLSFTNDGQNLLCSSNGNEVINVIHLGIQPEELK
jgi:WD40 repeat protein